jgi:cellulose synthase/poly-beta-1,6-N-acetylglucosamine synthase-like glycosyltransferase
MPRDDTQVSSASVVIATLGRRPAALGRCLRALRDQTVAPSAVIVVHNSNGDDATEAVAADAGATYLVERRGGVSHARNLGARSATDEVVAFLDDDGVPAAGWLAALLTEFRDPDVAAVTGQIVDIAAVGGEDHPAPAVAPDRIIFGGPTRLTFDRSMPDWFERANFGGIGQGANLAIRRSVFASWPGFDERLGAGTSIVGAEEHHAFFSLIDRGYRVVYTPFASVYHPYPHGDGELRRHYLRQIQTASAYLALLVVEERGHRRRAARYGLRAMAGRPRTWKTEPAALQFGTFDIAFARLSGMAAYVRMRFRPVPSDAP